MTIYRSSSSEETKQLGELLAKKLNDTRYPIPDTRIALVLALQGELGAGKTTFTQGFFKGLGISRHAVSPTFVIMRRYAIPAGCNVQSAKRKTDARRRAISAPRFADVYHFDAYRLKKAEDLEVLEFGSILVNPKSIIIIEWPEQIRKALPKSSIWLKFEHGKKENERRIKITI